MLYRYARVSAVLGMDVNDYYADAKRRWLRLHEKGGKFNEVPVHHKLEEYMTEYRGATGIVGQANGSLLRPLGRHRPLANGRINGHQVLAMTVKRRARDANLPASVHVPCDRHQSVLEQRENLGTRPTDRVR